MQQADWRTRQRMTPITKSQVMATPKRDVNAKEFAACQDAFSNHAAGSDICIVILETACV